MHTNTQIFILYCGKKEGGEGGEKLKGDRLKEGDEGNRHFNSDTLCCCIDFMFMLFVTLPAETCYSALHPVRVNTLTL